MEGEGVGVSVGVGVGAAISTYRPFVPRVQWPSASGALAGPSWRFVFDGRDSGPHWLCGLVLRPARSGPATGVTSRFIAAGTNARAPGLCVILFDER